MVDRIYPAELQSNKANSSDTEALFLDLNLSISNDAVSTKMYDKQGDFDIITFPFIDSDVPRRTSYTVMILSFRTDRPGQTLQTQIRLLLQEQSDQGLHSLPFRLHRLDPLLYGRAT